MAQAIYREWFVHFRYPGHEEVTTRRLPIGPIPEGWEVTTCWRSPYGARWWHAIQEEPAKWDDGEIPSSHQVTDKRQTHRRTNQSDTSRTRDSAEALLASFQQER